MRKRIHIAFLVLPLLALACSQESGTAKAAPQPTPSPAPKAEARRPISEEEAARLLPGFPVQDVPAQFRQTLVSMAEDEFVFDGSPFTLAGCLRDDRPCKEEAIRGLSLLLRLLQAGARENEALAAYNRYYGSFRNRSEIDLSGAACTGPEDAAVTLVEFSDFECPYCDAARPILKSAMAGRSDVRLCFMHFPLPGHAHAMSAAQATVFAQRHGKFWQLHDLLFDNQRRLSDSTIRSLVEQVGLDTKALVEAIRSGELAAVVDKQKSEGVKLGVQGTPTIFINGRKLELPLRADFLQLTLDDELRWKSNGSTWSRAEP